MESGWGHVCGDVHAPAVAVRFSLHLDRFPALVRSCACNAPHPSEAASRLWNEPVVNGPNRTESPISAKKQNKSEHHFLRWPTPNSSHIQVKSYVPVCAFLPWRAVVVAEARIGRRIHNGPWHAPAGAPRPAHRMGLYLRRDPMPWCEPTLALEAGDPQQHHRPGEPGGECQQLVVSFPKKQNKSEHHFLRWPTPNSSHIQVKSYVPVCAFLPWRAVCFSKYLIQVATSAFPTLDFTAFRGVLSPSMPTG